jgi:hypothetical protein
MPHIWQSFSSDLTRQAIVFSKHSPLLEKHVSPQTAVLRGFVICLGAKRRRFINLQHHKAALQTCFSAKHM